MPAYIFTCKDNATDEELSALKDEIKSQGGTIEHEYTIFKGFSATLPDDAVGAFDAHPYVENVEADGVMTTQ
ncbi:hypothetical protein ACMFMG_000467 [Clarireedia jacksonii]